MTPLNKKLFRDIRRAAGQVLAIAVVIAAGVAVVVMSLGTFTSLRETRDAYYDRYRFADVFAQAKRAPELLGRRIAAIPGVAQVETRILHGVLLDMPALDEPVRAAVQSLPENGEPVLNALVLRTGRWIRASHPEETIVGEAFAEAHGLRPGDPITATINGKRRTLRVVGIAMSPEHVYVIGPGDLVPDDLRYGILWMGREALEAAYDLEGAFNDVSVRLTWSASEPAVIERLDALLAPYGGIGAYGRTEQISDFFLRSEMDQLSTMAGIIPPIFLAVAAFLLNVVVSRLVETEREEIGVLKAFGYSNVAVGWHYMKLVLAIAVIGVGLGWAFGIWMGRGVTAMYADYYRFPFLYYAFDPAVVAGAGLAGLAAAASGAIFAVRRAARLPPAVAMTPPPPTVYRGTLIERSVFARRAAPATRMILRHITRWPVRSLTTIGGIAAAVSLLVMTLFFIDSVDVMLDSYFNQSQRQDVDVQFTEVREDAIGAELARLPGVLKVELYRAEAVRFRHGHLSRRVALLGIEPDADLSRLVDDSGRPVTVPSEGLLLTGKLASLLGAGEGDTVIAEMLEGRRPVVELPVARVVEEFIGINAYMDRRALNRALRDASVATGANLLIDGTARPELFRRLKDLPAVLSVADLGTALATFRTMIDGTILQMVSFYVLFAGLIAIGVVYNSARISLSERARELASLRVLGFYRAEVAYILLGELAILTALSLPIGCLVGYGLVSYMVTAFDTDLYRLPFAVERSTYGWAVVVVVLAAAGSGLLVARRVAYLDLVAVLKTRE
ncbi:MAG: FtsX-like permease family protein [Inquilinus sp.]|nr:FtsX-like permease family protein [Inquilinus sp.]